MSELRQWFTDHPSVEEREAVAIKQMVSGRVRERASDGQEDGDAEEEGTGIGWWPARYPSHNCCFPPQQKTWPCR